MCKSCLYLVTSVCPLLLTYVYSTRMVFFHEMFWYLYNCIHGYRWLENVIFLSERGALFCVCFYPVILYAFYIESNSWGTFVSIFRFLDIYHYKVRDYFPIIGFPAYPSDDSHYGTSTLTTMNTATSQMW
jgi:hypothetical protein